MWTLLGVLQATGLAAVTAAGGTLAHVLAQAEPPVTLVGCLVAVVMGLMALNVLVVRWLLAQVEASRKLVETVEGRHTQAEAALTTAFGREVGEVRQTAETRLAGERTAWFESVKAMREESQREREHAARDREQWALLADADRQRRRAEYEALLARVDGVTARLKGVPPCAS